MALAFAAVAGVVLVCGVLFAGCEDFTTGLVVFTGPVDVGGCAFAVLASDAVVLGDVLELTDAVLACSFNVAAFCTGVAGLDELFVSFFAF